jgi:hypothetical protein
MKRSNLEKYYLSMAPIKEMFDMGTITNPEYQKAESFLADKYCIKKGNLYRLNNLTIPRKRVIYMIPEEEVKCNEENNNQVRRITEVSKEN